MVIIVIISQSVTILQAGHRGVVLFVGAVENRACYRNVFTSYSKSRSAIGSWGDSNVI